MYHIAHRGYSDLHKDNTFESFKSAIDNHFDMIEMDLVLTKDKQIAVYHDTFFEDKLIINITLDELKKYDSEILSLQEFFDKIDHTKINLYLDIKGNNIDICEILEKILNVANNPNVFIGSFNFCIIQNIKKINPSRQVGFITENIFNENIFKVLCEIGISFVCFHWTSLDSNMIEYLHNKGIYIFTYTCKNKNIEEFMKQYNIDGIVSNYKLNDP